MAIVTTAAAAAVVAIVTTAAAAAVVAIVTTAAAADALVYCAETIQRWTFADQQSENDGGGRILGL